MKTNIKVKSKKDLDTMAEGGKKLGKIKKKLIEIVSEGKNANDVEKLASKLISGQKGKPSFKMVPGYSWATCVNVNEGVVHGIPRKKVVFKKGDVVSVDIGMFYKGFHTDTSFSVGISPSRQIKDFLKVGEKALENGIGQVKPNNRIFDISKAIQETLEKANLEPVRDLVGHGIGKKLHEAPQIPCFVTGERKKSPKIPEGVTLAIEVMYAMGNSSVGVGDDGWTISTQDGKISALFEETAAACAGGPIVLTRSD